jgi:alginate O-acetyltransferase complex protein AlgI
MFLPIILLVNSLVKAQYRNQFLLVASLLFYAWGESFYVSVMLGSIIVSYLGGVLINYFKNQQNASLSNVALYGFVGINILALIYFKYASFLIVNLHLEQYFDSQSYQSIHLPLGISFFTFHTLSYLIDVYKDKISVQKNLADHALYVTLFPQLVAGPIVRYHDISKQIAHRNITKEKTFAGILRFSTGLCKKVIISNPLALVADASFNSTIDAVSPVDAWLGIICYSLQIYFDFSGYSDMAIGLGKMLGFDFLENFNYPYISKSIQEFWRRWHISLSSWFRDYVYIPLGGSKGGNFKTYRNIAIVFLLTGMWHGASWNFVAWGAFHGSFIMLERAGLNKVLLLLPKFVQNLYMLIIVLIGWIFFRANTFEYGFFYLKRMFGLSVGDNYNYEAIINFNNYTVFVFVIALVFVFPIRKTIVKYVYKNSMLKLNIPSASFRLVFGSLNIVFVLVVLLLSSMELAASSYNPFIYFRF